MLKNKKANMAIKVIIAAIIGMIILFTLMFIFSNESKKSISVLGSCEARGGSCETEDDCKDDGERKIEGIECPGSNICCLTI